MSLGDTYHKYYLDGTSKVQVINRKLLYSTVGGNYYDFNDLLSAFNLTQYSQQITSIQMSENSNYMLLVLDRNGKTQTIAIKLSFDNGLDAFMRDNLQPM